MAESLKTFFSAALVRKLAQSLSDVHPAFPARAFVRDATRGLEDLELLARGKHIATTLHVHLPPRYVDAVETLVRSLGPENVGEELEGVGMGPFFYLPHTMFVSMYGLDDFDASMQAQHELTRRFTCEFSIRTFLERHPDATLAVLRRWTTDPSAFVRRLVSEGTRSRLPWGKKVRWISEHPERVLPLIELLKDDPASVVRRSVANHLNDLTKSHPDLVHGIAKRWLEDATPERRAIVVHALRSAVKRGDRTALALLGFGAKAKVEVFSPTFSPARPAIGEKTRVAFELRSTSRLAQSLTVDLVVHFQKVRGTSAKVFKIAQVTLAPGEAVTLGKSISLAVHTTRKPHAGTHVVEVMLNGERRPLGAFSLRG